MKKLTKKHSQLGSAAVEVRPVWALVRLVVELC
jgi:hypothetical protein